MSRCFEREYEGHYDVINVYEDRLESYRDGKQMKTVFFMDCPFYNLDEALAIRHFKEVL